VDRDQRQRAVADDRDPLPRPRLAAADRAPGHGGRLGERGVEQADLLAQRMHHLGGDEHLIGGFNETRAAVRSAGWR